MVNNKIFSSLIFNLEKSNLLTTFDDFFISKHIREIASHNKYCKRMQQRFVIASKQMKQFCHIKHILYAQRICTQISYSLTFRIIMISCFVDRNTTTYSAMTSYLDITASILEILHLILFNTTILAIKYRFGNCNDNTLH